MNTSFFSTRNILYVSFSLRLGYTSRVYSLFYKKEWCLAGLHQFQKKGYEEILVMEFCFINPVDFFARDGAEKKSLKVQLLL